MKESGGVITIEKWKEIFVKHLTESFRDVTLRMTGILLENVKDEIQAKKNTEEIVIYTINPVSVELSCVFEKRLTDELVTRMNRGIPPASYERELYLKEYINMIGGIGVSAHNDFFREKLKLTIPYYLASESELDEWDDLAAKQKELGILSVLPEQIEKKEISYLSEFGRLDIIIKFLT